LEANQADDIQNLKVKCINWSLHQFVRVVSALKSIEVIEEEINSNPLGQKRKKKWFILTKICQLVFTELESLHGFSKI
jgi:hypothetical protein